MAEARETIQTVYVNQDGAAVLKCPTCETVKISKVQDYKGERHIVKVRCNCKNVFTVSLEFRKNYRKETKLTGDFFGVNKEGLRGKMLVLNLSKGGLGARVIGMNSSQVGDELRVRFTLNDQNNSLIEKRVVVRLVKQNYIGCEFLDSTTPDKALGFYLMV
jgi:uncharacterized C2H2 Zn-finger protein